MHLVKIEFVRRRYPGQKQKMREDEKNNGDQRRSRGQNAGNRR